MKRALRFRRPALRLDASRSVAALKGLDKDELLFDAKPTLQPDNRSYRSRRMIEGQFEKAAFQFQR